MTLILGAMDGEIAEARRGIVDARSESWHGFGYWHGHLGEEEVIVARAGVGKTLSAMVCQRLIDLYHPAAILFTGVAGALNPRLEIGDTLIARDCIIHDMDATKLGFQRGEIPYTGFRLLQCDPGLVAAASSIEPLEGRMMTGRVLTGDQFVSESSVRSELRDTLHGDAVEMEGASVGLVATVNEIPFLLIRTISDKADGHAGVDFGRFLQFASRNSWHYLRQITLKAG